MLGDSTGGTIGGRDLIEIMAIVMKNRDGDDRS